MRVLWKFSLRHARHRPLRSLLTLTSIVLGVALVVAVIVATSTTRSAYYELFSTVTGKTALEVVPRGGGLFDAGELERIEAVPGVAAAAPILQRPTILFHDRGRVKLLALGVDPDRDGAIRTYQFAEGRMPRPREAAMAMEMQFARSLGLKLGDRARILTRDGGRELELVGLLKVEGSDALRLAGVMFLPLDRAQQFFRARGQVESIQIVVADHEDEAAVIEKLSAVLPPELQSRRPAIRTQIMDETLNASQQALQWITAFALLSAAFIILNTFLMSIGERRQQLAVMRCVGATRQQLGRLVLGESLVFGVVGSLLGIGLGLLGAFGLGEALSRLMQVHQPPMKITWVPIVSAFAFGLLLSALGAIVPTIVAARLSPLEGLAPVLKTDVHGHSRRTTIAGLAMVFVGSAVLAAGLAAWLPIEVGTYAAGVIMIGFVLLTPEVLSFFTESLSWLLTPFLQIKARLAHREILRHRVRSSLTVGVLFIATSTGLGMANAILDSTHDTRQWYERTLVGDFFIRAMMPDMTGAESANIPDEMGEELARVEGIERLTSAKFLQADAAGQQVVVIVRDFRPDQPITLDLRGADPGEVLQRLFQGEVIVGTVLAQRAKISVGDEIPLETRQGVQRVRVAALSNEYLVGGLAIYMERGTAKRLLHVDGVDAFVIKARPNQRSAVEAQLRPICEKYGVVLHSFADLATMIDGMIRGIEAGLWGTIVVCFAVAAIGVFNTLTMNVLEQTRELGMLRIVAMTRGQVRALVFTQAGIIGLAGLITGAIGGLITAYFMHMAMMQSIGHPVPFIFRPMWYLAMIGVGLLIVLIAAWLPAERAARLDLASALHYE